MIKNTILNTILVPVISASATVSVALLSSDKILLGLLAALATFMFAAAYELLP
jgi:hypothetical protein